MGVSTICLIWVMYLCKTGKIPRGAIYWLPTYSLMKDFANTKVDPLIRDNTELARAAGKTKDNYNLGLKYLYGIPTLWRGLESKAGVKSISGDAAVYDEFDEADLSQVKQARERLSASDVKLERELSVPTLPDYGINHLFQETDQCHWVFKCESCSTWNILEREFPNCFQQNSEGVHVRVCKKCRRDISHTKGQWVALNPKSKIRGYQISQLYSPFITPDQLMKEYRTTEFMGHFYNHKLGMPYLSATDRVTSDQVLQLCEQARPMGNASLAPTSMGIDVGSKLHIVIIQRVNDKFRVLWAGEKSDFSELQPLIKSFSVRSAVIDALPETRKSREFANVNNPKGYICFYSSHQKGSYSWNDDQKTVAVNRTESLDAGTEMLLNEKIHLPRRDSTMEEFAKHCANIAKVAEEDKETGSKVYVYKKIGPDHYRHALNYAMIAASKMANVAFTSVFR
jgi:hypothetical protein